MKRQKANSLENITWSELEKQNIQVEGLLHYITLPAVFWITEDVTFIHNTRHTVIVLVS